MHVGEDGLTVGYLPAAGNGRHISWKDIEHIFVRNPFFLLCFNFFFKGPKHSV